MPNVIKKKNTYWVRVMGDGFIYEYGPFRWKWLAYVNMWSQ